jgi:hypothetical protein
VARHNAFAGAAKIVSGTKVSRRGVPGAGKNSSLRQIALVPGEPTRRGERFNSNRSPLYLFVVASCFHETGSHFRARCSGANPVLIESGFALFSLCGRIFGRRTGIHFA